MPVQNYQVRESRSRTVLITVRVAPEVRELLHELAEERGETLSRLMVSRTLMLRKRVKPQKIVRGTAVEPAVNSEPACEPKPSLPARPDGKRMRDVSVMPGQASLFGDQ